MSSLPPLTPPGLFEAQVSRTPDAVALVWAEGEPQATERQLTYRELNERANRLARQLIGLWAGPERLVALALPRGEPAIVALLAVVKTGAAYLPVDPRLPTSRMSFMLADSGPVPVVTDTATAARLPGAGPPGKWPPLVLADDPAMMAITSARPGSDLSDGDRTVPLLPAHPVYVIYTSGSTGTPKAVVVSHASLASLVAAHIAMHAVGPGSKLLVGYGPTEYTVTTTHYRAQPADAQRSGPLPIGTPLRPMREPGSDSSADAGGSS
jgi:non-ribosomal peptide synthetase component F